MIIITKGVVAHWRCENIFTNKLLGVKDVPNCFYMKSSNSLGFTLLELLVVMVIIGLLVSYVGPKYFAQIGKSEVKTVKAQIDAFEKALDQYRLDTGHYPSTEQGLAALNIKPVDVNKWAGPYLKKTVPSDPWGNIYLYKSPGEHSEFDLYSLGNDGKSGGKDDAADVGNW